MATNLGCYLPLDKRKPTPYPLVMLNEREWITVAEAAREVGCTPQAVRERWRDGKLTAEKHFGVLVVRRSQLAKWQKERAARALKLAELL